VVIRIAHRGHVNRHLRGLRLGDSPALPFRTPLYSEAGKEVGWLSSSAHSPRVGEMIGLGTVRREVEPGSTVRVGTPDGPAAEVSGLPFIT
jgi:glycine cleavage system aminomethyltransferase T